MHELSKNTIFQTPFYVSCIKTHKFPLKCYYDQMFMKNIMNPIFHSSVIKKRAA